MNFLRNQSVSKKATRGRSNASSSMTLGQVESRTLMSFSAHVNSAPATAAGVSGYIVDSGSTYGARNGLTYGWNTNLSTQTRNRDAANSPDQLHDTLVQMPAGSTWEIAVPTGTYDVKVVAGDPSYWNSVYQLNVEGKSAINSTPTSTNPWATSTVTVTVTDGKLTITGGSGGVNNKIDFVDISTSGATGSTVLQMAPANATGLVASGLSTS